MKKISMLLLILSIVPLFGGTVQVVFRVNMKAQIIKNLFNTARDSVCVRGDFQIPAGDPDGNWQGNRFQLRDMDRDSIYILSVNIPDTYVDSLFNFKFVRNTDGWEGGDNRQFRLRNETQQILYPYWLNNDSVTVLKQIVTNKFVFTADLSADYGHGIAYFDPDTDSILVMGMDWDGLGTLISGNRKMTEISDVPKHFRTTLVVKGPLGDSTKWKYRQLPGNKFSNSGWELGGDHWVKFKPDGDTVILPEMVPKISMVNVTARISDHTFRVNMKRQILCGTFKVGLDSLFVRGTFQWLSPDTCPIWQGYSFKLSDPDCDSIYSIIIPLSCIGIALEQEYKFLIDTGSIETSPPWRFWVNIDNTVLPVVWFNNQPLAVDERIFNAAEKSFLLLRGYPNPFNPECKIIYSVPQPARVSLKIFDILGNEVACLIDEEVTPGLHSVNWNAASRSSGTYICRIAAGAKTAAIKLILIK